MSEAFPRERETFIDWLRDEAIPLFAGSGRAERGYHEALTTDGAPIEGAPTRLRVQARQAWSFARAGALGLMKGHREASDHAWRFMVDHGLDDRRGDLPRGFIHVFDAQGGVADPRRDAYDHGFVLLAAAERKRVYGDPEADEVATIAEALLEHLRHREGGFAEALPSALPRRQNPHMHLLEACLLWRRAGPRPFTEAAIGEVMALWKRHFFDSRAGVLREFFAEDWASDPERGATVEPGHMAEWVWLLDEEGSSATSDLVALLDGARRTGLFPGTPLLANSFDLASGERSGDGRLWAQTEHIRACLVLARRADAADAWRDEATRLLAGFRRIYRSGVCPGGWQDNVAADGTPLSDRMPASLLYHVMTLADELLRPEHDRP